MQRPFILAAGMAMIAVTCCAPQAHAQLLDQLKSATGTGGGGMGMGGMSGGLPSVGQAGAGNTAGVLQYCIQNNYLSAGSAGSVKDSLLGRVPGRSNDSGYRQGSNGSLDTGNGQDYSLGGSSGSGSLKQQATRKVCDLVLQHAKSLF